MKKLIILLLAMLMCLPAMAEIPLPEEAQITSVLSPFAFALPEDVTLMTAPGGASVIFLHENGTTRVVGMVLSRVPDEDGDHAAELQQLMGKFAPDAEEGMPLALTPGFHGLMALTPDALEGMNGTRVDQVTIMVLWQTALRGELLILSGYDMIDETERAEAMLNLLLRAATVYDAPVVPVETPEEE